MKKLLPKRRKKESVPTRITNETVAEHREKILAGGKRYKYPLQYTKHKLVVNAIVIGVLTVFILVLFGWWQLYIAQNSNTFFYRITRIVPLPVASVDGTTARYSDYLLNYRISEYYLNKYEYDQNRSNSDDGKLQLQYMKREALDIAVADALARRIAGEASISVSNDEVRGVLDNLRNAANGRLSEETSNASSQRVLGLSMTDRELLVRNSLLRSKAAFAIDQRAEATMKKAEQLLSTNSGDLEKTAQALNAERENSATYGVSGLIDTSASLDGLQAAEIAKLEQGKLSSPLRSITMHGYYFVKVLEKNDTQVSFAFIRIPLSAFEERLVSLRSDGKINEYISITIDQPQTSEGEE